MGCGTSTPCIQRSAFGVSGLATIQIPEGATTEFTRHYLRPVVCPDKLKIFKGGLCIDDPNFIGGKSQMLKWCDIFNMSFERHEIKGYFKFVAVVADKRGSHSLQEFSFCLCKSDLNAVREAIMGTNLCEYSEFSLGPKFVPQRMITRTNGIEMTDGGILNFKSEFHAFRNIHNFACSTGVMSGTITYDVTHLDVKAAQQLAKKKQAAKKGGQKQVKKVKFQLSKGKVKETKQEIMSHMMV